MRTGCCWDPAAPCQASRITFWVGLDVMAGPGVGVPLTGPVPERLSQVEQASSDFGKDYCEGPWEAAVTGLPPELMNEAQDFM